MTTLSPPFQKTFPIPIGPRLMVRNNRVRAELCRRKLSTFFKFFWDTFSPLPLQMNWHIPALCDEVQMALTPTLNNEPKDYDLIVNISPGSSKSSIISIAAPPFCWAVDPTFTMLCVSNTNSLTMEFARKTLGLMQSAKFHDLYPHIEIDRVVLDDITTSQKGHRYATSTESNFVGKHAKAHFYDDALSVKQSKSDADRKMVNMLLEEQYPSRVYEPKKLLRIYVMQRLGIDDPSQRRLNNADMDPVRHVCFPSELTKNVKPREYRKNYVKLPELPDCRGTFDVVRFDAATLRKLRASPGYGAQYLQDPKGTGGGLFNVDEIQIFEHTPRMLRTVRAWDRGFSIDGDPSAGAKMGEDEQKRYWILDLRHGWWQSYQREQQMKQAAQLDGKQTHIIIEGESGPGKELAKITLKTVLKDFPRKSIVSPHDPKETRAEAFSSEVNIGNVYMVRAAWNQTVLDELRAFPEPGVHDDIVDALSMCCQWLLKPSVTLGALDV